MSSYIIDVKFNIIINIKLLIIYCYNNVFCGEIKNKTLMNGN